MATKFLDDNGLLYFWGKIKSYITNLLSSKADDSDVVHKAEDENVTGTKTFVGSKKVAFKQSGANDKLGFTLYNNSSVEQGYLEYNPTNKISNVPLFTLGNYASAASGLSYIGFRRYSSISGASGAYNLLAPLISDAKSHFNLTTTYTNFFLPLGISDGTTIATADSGGVFDISSLTQASNTITAMTSYAKANASSAIATSDSLNTAIGKLEYKIDVLNANSVPPLEVVSLTADISLTVTDSYTYQKVICLNTSGITVTLPTCSSSDARFFIKNNTNSKCYLALASGVTLDGSSGTIDLDPYGYINVIYGGSANTYIIIGGSI